MSRELQAAITSAVEYSKAIDHRVEQRIDRLSTVIEDMAVSVKSAVQGLEGSAAGMESTAKAMREETAHLSELVTVTQNLLTRMDEKSDQKFTEMQTLMAHWGAIAEKQAETAAQNAQSVARLTGLVEALLSRN